ncbi:MAG: DUF4920 domain-containing protein [Bradymonadaceae bacterium]
MNKINVIRLLAFSLAITLIWGCDDKPEAAPEPEEAPVVEEEEQASDDGTENEEAAQELAADLDPGQTRHFGAPFTIEDEPITLASALELAADGSGPYKVEATVQKVCKKKGCWFTLAADEVEIPIRVRMKDYGFFVARNTDGAKVILEGSLEKTVVPEAMAQHFADDEVEGTDKEAEKIDGDQETFEFMATGIEMSQPSA